MTEPLPAERRAPDSAAAAAALAGAVSDALADALRARGVARLAVSGGRTPRRLFETLAAAPLDWSRIVVSLVDERWTPETDPRSNAGFARQALLRGPAAAAAFLPLYRKGTSPDEAAASPAPALRTFLEEGPDAAVLGLGTDHHTASLFPGAPEEALDPAGLRLLVATTAPDGAERRLSMTVAALARARRLHLQIEGAEKIAAYAALKARAGAAPPNEAPALALLAPPLAERLTVWIAPA